MPASRAMPRMPRAIARPGLRSRNVGGPSLMEKSASYTTPLSSSMASVKGYDPSGMFGGVSNIVSCVRSPGRSVMLCGWSVIHSRPSARSVYVVVSRPVFLRGI